MTLPKMNSNCYFMKKEVKEFKCLLDLYFENDARSLSFVAFEMGKLLHSIPIRSATRNQISEMVKTTISGTVKKSFKESYKKKLAKEFMKMVLDCYENNFGLYDGIYNI